MRKDKSICTVLLIVTLFVTGGCSGAAPASPATQASPAKQPAAVVSATGKVMPAQWATLSMPAAEVVTQLLVEEGQAIEAGAPLVRLQDDAVQAAHAEAEAALAAAQARLALAEEGARAEEIAAAEAAVKTAEALAAQAAAQRDQVLSGARADDLTVAQAGLSQAEAQHALEALGLVMGKVTYHQP